jgi:glycosyltransferase involved in cell wall biosynthesis
MDKKKISIIIATYNADKFLQTCLNSIIPQLNDFIELIIMDGGSTDQTIKIIEGYEKHISFWISKEDKGIYDAWNKGVKRATGEWILFLGADDILFPEAISDYVNLLGTKDLSQFDYISAYNEYVDKSGKLLKILGGNAYWKNMKKTMSAAHVGSLHNKENLFGQVGYYSLDYEICADYELLLRKKDKLKSFFLNKKIAKMEVGGMSFTLKAVYETYKIRKLHKTISSFRNNYLLLRDIFGYKIFKFRKSLCANI